MAAATEKVKEFWAKLDSMDHNATKQAEFILEQTKQSSETDNQILLNSTCPTSGHSLMEYVCSFELLPTEDDSNEQYKEHSVVSDCFNHLIEKSLAVTDKCYDLVLEKEADDFRLDVLKSLLHSGYLPKTMHGKKPLDFILDVMQEFMDECALDGGDMGDLFGPLVLAPHVKVGVTHEENGSFEGWVEEVSDEDPDWMDFLKEKYGKEEKQDSQKTSRKENLENGDAPDAKKARTE